jgi:hypothetical protein
MDVLKSVNQSNTGIVSLKTLDQMVKLSWTRVNRQVRGLAERSKQVAVDNGYRGETMIYCAPDRYFASDLIDQAAP